MDTTRSSRAVTVIGAIAAVILQIVLAPNIAISGVVPNIILIFVIINAINKTPISSTVLGFFLGLIADLISTGPVGLSALVFSIIAFAVSSLNKGMFTGAWLIELAALIAAVFFGELLYAVVLTIMGIEEQFLTALVYVTLPSVVYDALLGLIILPIISAINKRTQKNITNLGRRLR
jgi:rod shape-determining protein MreD